MGAVRNLCKSGILLDKGQIIFSGTAADTIENYLSDRTESYESQNRELSKYRLPDLPLDVVFTSIVVSNETSLTTKEDIEIIFKVFGNKAAKNFRLYLTIYNSEEVPIGGIFDETYYSITEGEEKTIRLLLKSHNLTKGDYYVSYALGRGDFKQGISAIDIVDKYSKLTVAHYDSSLDYAIWNKGWGNIMFESKSGEI
jgi:lipopolysaccharide transport system ATP-binding protein